MAKTLVVAALTALALALPATAAQKKKAVEKKKVETGASCKAPAVGRCAACSITCRPGETAQCSSGVVVSDVCHTQPSCRCGK